MSSGATFGFQDVDPAEKPGLVRGVFDRVASRYDLMNDLMSGGVHRLWKDAAAARLNAQPGEFIVDCAGGTGDMARRFARMAEAARRRRGGDPAQVLVIDYNGAMIEAGRARETDDAVAWSVGDAQALPLPDGVASAYCIAFGLRNVTDISKALVEARRVLRPGGRSPVPGVFQADHTGHARGLRRLFFQADPGDRRPGRQRPRGLSISGGEHPPLPRSTESRRTDDQSRLRPRRRDQLQRRGLRPPPRLGDLTEESERRAEGLAAWGRLIGLAWTLARADALAPRELDLMLSPGARTLARGARLLAGPASRRGRPGERLALALERSGPVAIKFGQFLSTRADVFGQAFADDLAHLKDQLPAFPTSEARAEVERALGRPIADLFAEFGEPAAAASLAQAHRARLKDGRAVAVKVLRPSVEARVAADIGAMMLAGRLAENWRAARRLEPVAFTTTVARALRLELDLRFEAAGADELRSVMADDGHMAAPAVVWEGVARRVLTLEWASGMALSDAAALEQSGLDRRRLAENLVRGFLAQALDHGVFHADLHEGNLFAAAPAAIKVVDFGIVGRLGEAERRYLAQILWGFIQRDYARVAQIHFEAGYVPPAEDPAAFAQALRAVGEPLFGKTASEVSMERLLTQLFEIPALFGMRLRPELRLLQKTMGTVEGVARRIDPGLDIWGAAEPVVRRWITRELSPIARVRSLATEARAAAAAITTLVARDPDVPAPVKVAGPTPWLGFTLGALTAALVFLLATMLR